MPGSLIAYAAAPGKPALDGKNGQNSPYVKHLLEWIQAPNLSIADALTEVRMAVIKATHGQQQPQYSNALNEKFSFFPQTKQEEQQGKREEAQQAAFDERLESLLETCQLHFQAQRAEVAWDCYQKVLQQAPTNKQAIEGLNQIEAYYVKLIEQALGDKQVNAAQRYLTILGRLNSSSAKLLQLETQLANLQRQVIYIPGDVFQDRLKDGSKGPQMVWIAAGSFEMGDIQGGGDGDEKPVHRVSITQNFGMGRYEVTNAEFVRFLNTVKRRGPQNEPWFQTKKEDSYSHIIGSTGNFRVESGYENHPVIEVSWYGATAYAKWIATQTGQKYRLPTEAQWEYVARAGTTTKYWWGNEIGSNKGNCSDSGDRFEYTAPVGSFKANPFGIYDTVGNVWEWTQDIYSKDYYSNSIYSDPTGPSTGSYRVLRGGGWFSPAPYCRAAFRNLYSPGLRGIYLGFRLLRQP
ncbi:Sulphatase-modifying factor domain protein [Candidatus Thiomargarita nelsonii]|uniref:Sulphatase-modifying factor domain protein n=1 Tax=Candidatus Thiomargarita nelsonii TaxID=1003181 RepID=A0A176RTR8_9GAMM|nr:Sulphatase-modifying factor domain protein [Candidatus Thiomargarita nelsonii]